MSRPTLSICVRCEHGDELHERVRALRKQRGLKVDFKVEAVRCLDLCDNPCAIRLEGKKRSTYLRARVQPAANVEQVIAAACAYAALAPGDELPERVLPGVHED